MKKLMIAAAIVCAAAMSQAAAVTWSVNMVQAPTGGNASTGWLVQVFDATTAYSYDAAKAGTITAEFTAATTAVGTTDYVMAMQTKAASKLGANDEGNYYMVIYDAATVAGANNYIVSAYVPYSVNELDKDITVTWGSMTGTTLATNKFYGAEWQSVPEPTSGLLLLLGVAGLALRRRRA